MKEEEIKIFYNKTVAENADYYYNLAKKYKNKLPGILNTIKKTENELKDALNIYKNYLKKKEIDEKIKIYTKKEWYEKYRFTRTFNSFLVVIGKDAISNEVLIKKYADPNDLILHSEMPGSPFGIIKNSLTKDISEEDIMDAGLFLLAFSKYWKNGFGTGDFFVVKPEQVSKKAPSGEFMGKGSFMIYGNKKIYKNVRLTLAVGYYFNRIIEEDFNYEYKVLFSGTERCCKKYCKEYVLLEPGNNENDKKVKKKIKDLLKIDIDDISKYIPSNSKIIKKMK